MKPEERARVKIDKQLNNAGCRDFAFNFFIYAFL